MNWSKGWSIGIAAVVVGLTTLGVGYWAGRRTPTASAPTTVAPPAAPTATVTPLRFSSCRITRISIVRCSVAASRTA